MSVVPDEARSVVGKSHAHDSARQHVTGAAVYLDDMAEAAGALHAALVKSPHAHARIRGIDAARALGQPGVVALVVAADIPGVNDVGPILHGEPALAVDVADYVGCPVAVVVAETHEAARRAADLVDVDWEPLPAVLGYEDAIAAQSYVAAPQHLLYGDAAAALAAAPLTLKGALDIGGQDHFYLETHIAVATPHEGGQMHVWTSSQHPTEVQKHVALVLGAPQAAVTVEVRRMGGGFGGKESQPTIVAAIAAVCARKTQRPVKLRLDRDDDMIVTGKRHDFRVEWEAGFDHDGALSALRMQLAARGGNVADLTPAVMTRAICHATNCYYVPNVDLLGLSLKTNTVSNTAFRGFGGPQGMIAGETVIDSIARHLGKDRDAVRRANYLSAERGLQTPYEQTVSDMIAADLMARLEIDADLPARQQAIAAFNAANRVKKRALATVPVMFGISFNMPSLNQGGALVHVYTDGSIQANHGGTEMGQGLYTKVAQVVAETFGVPMTFVMPTSTRTDKVPNTSATAASSGSDLNGAAARRAALTIRGRMADVAAELWGVSADAVTFRDGEVSSGNHVMPFAELANRSWLKRVSLSAAGFYATPDIHWDQTTLKGHPFYYFAYGAAASEVEIDTLTGETRCLRTDIIHDCGASLNPAIDLGQIEGGFVQGMGWLTMEELYWDGDGRLRTHAPSTYKIPGSRDAPPDFRVHLLENAPNRQETIFRSKAVGEPPLMLGMSVWLAIRDAVAACAANPRAQIPLDAPATPERILKAIEAVRA
ncbi:MAG: xanthine dehydrogenase molybdopterin binding subunit [Hyphomicrobiales bacterium]|nr:xanthine dehydrogenase molybdopterin binding subunit [Hyphomicrobiales bacterium]MDB5593115.1 xanthine dehydrogenase molybdopterin binding subunit [Hyphomicrobiales bacterium]